MLHIGSAETALSCQKEEQSWVDAASFQKEETVGVSWDGGASAVWQHHLLLAVFSLPSGILVLEVGREACLFLQRRRHLDQRQMTPQMSLQFPKGDSVLSS